MDGSLDDILFGNENDAGGTQPVTNNKSVERF
jgi:hypothetical protein